MVIVIRLKSKTEEKWGNPRTAMTIWNASYFSLMLFSLICIIPSSTRANQWTDRKRKTIDPFARLAPVVQENTERIAEYLALRLDEGKDLSNVREDARLFVSACAGAMFLMERRELSPDLREALHVIFVGMQRKMGVSINENTSLTWGDQFAVLYTGLWAEPLDEQVYQRRIRTFIDNNRPITSANAGDVAWALFLANVSGMTDIDPRPVLQGITEVLEAEDRVTVSFLLRCMVAYKFSDVSVILTSAQLDRIRTDVAESIKKGPWETAVLCALASSPRQRLVLPDKVKEILEEAGSLEEPDLEVISRCLSALSSSLPSLPSLKFKEVDLSHLELVFSH